ncbi:MAG TPA: acyl-CoA desaturase [Longimicrobiales bacterium]|nr:acyl-CoA desaturase [Longimicrobiales bacterium]
MAETAIATPQGEEFHDDIIYPATIPFLLIHLSAFAAIWTGVSLWAVTLCVGLYVVRMIIVTAGYHRYFSHRSFKTSRVGQFVLAFLAQTSLQRGVIWWAAIHRHHHKHSDTELDVHSPVHRSFLYSHVGWIFAKRDDTPDYSTVNDLTAYPELRFLERFHHLPWVIVAALFLIFGGWQALVVGWIWSTLLLYHGSFSINSLAHVHGNQRYVTGDDSRNNWWLAIITMGEGWHNNHHAYQSSTRQGFRWYEWDLTYYTLKVLSWFTIVWDLRSPPEEIVNNERRLGRKVVEQVAHQMAESFPVERMAAQVRAAWDQVPDLQEVRRDLTARYDSAKLRAGEARTYLATQLAAVQLPHVPTMDEIRQRVQNSFAHVPEVSLDDVAERTRQLLLEALSVRLLDDTGPLTA